MGSDDGVLAACELDFAYGERPVLHEVSLEARPGDVVGLLGPNGSGKSTLLGLLSGVLRPTRGTARWRGRALDGIPRRELARELAVVPQEPEFGFPFTALEIVLMGRHPHLAGLGFESATDLALAREALARCGAAELADRSIHALSSGERQRVVFARALAQEPDCLLLDEPASFLDIRHQVELYDQVRELAHDDGCTVVTALHDLNLAAEYCDRIVLVRDGRVEAAGTTAEVFSYANLTRVFETELYVDVNDLTGSMLVIPLSGRVQARLRDGRDDGGSATS